MLVALNLRVNTASEKGLLTSECLRKIRAIHNFNLIITNSFKRLKFMLRSCINSYQE